MNRFLLNLLAVMLGFFFYLLLGKKKKKVSFQSKVINPQERNFEQITHCDWNKNIAEKVHVGMVAS